MIKRRGMQITRSPSWDKTHLAALIFLYHCLGHNGERTDGITGGECLGSSAP